MNSPVAPWRQGGGGVRTHRLIQSWARAEIDGDRLRLQRPDRSMFLDLLIDDRALLLGNGPRCRDRLLDPAVVSELQISSGYDAPDPAFYAQGGVAHPT